MFLSKCRILGVFDNIGLFFVGSKSIFATIPSPPTGTSPFKPFIQNPAPGALVPPIRTPQDGSLMLDRIKFTDSFASDVNPDMTAFMADSQVSWGIQALTGAVTEPAWKSKPSWYLVATDDRMIPPDAQRAM